MQAPPVRYDVEDGLKSRGMAYFIYIYIYVFPARIDDRLSLSVRLGLQPRRQ